MSDSVSLVRNKVESGKSWPGKSHYLWMNPSLKSSICKLVFRWLQCANYVKFVLTIRISMKTNKKYIWREIDTSEGSTHYHPIYSSSISFFAPNNDGDYFRLIRELKLSKIYTVDVNLSQLRFYSRNISLTIRRNIYEIPLLAPRYTYQFVHLL